MALETFEGRKGIGIGAKFPILQGETIVVETIDHHRYKVRPRSGKPSKKGYLKLELDPMSLRGDLRESYLQMRQANLSMIEDEYSFFIHNARRCWQRAGNEQSFEDWLNTSFQPSLEVFAKERQRYSDAWLVCHNIYHVYPLVVRYPDGHPLLGRTIAQDLGKVIGWEIIRAID